MNQFLYESRCKCKEKISLTKKRKSMIRRESKPLAYPNLTEVTSKTFRIKYEKPLSSISKCLLNSFQNKYLYYAIDDILYSLNPNSSECDNLLAILYSPVLFLQNNLSINFFDIWIQETYITKISETNKFLKTTNQKFDSFHLITIRFLYKPKVPIKQPESFW